MAHTPEESISRRSRTIAFVFPGQGSQYVGMGADLIARSPAAADAFERADAALGMPLSRLILEGPADELDQTVNAQPAILATSVAFLEAIRAEAHDAGIEIKPTAMAGHSAGQYAAAVAADAIDYADALRLVRERGRIMQERGIAGGLTLRPRPPGLRPLRAAVPPPRRPAASVPGPRSKRGRGRRPRCRPRP